MVKKVAFLVITVLIGLVSFGIATAQAVDCAVVYCVYLPLVNKSISPTPTPTPNPTSTPTPTSTPGFTLQDGWYLAEFSNGGYIQFSVKGNGTIAYGAGFLVQFVSICPWGAYTFSGSEPINNGAFGFIAVDYINRSLLAELSCGSISTTQALCHAHRWGTGSGVCSPSASGVATKR